MEFTFSDRRLRQLYTEGTGAHRYPTGVADAFLRRVRSIQAATDERDLRVPASVHFEKLSGNRAGSYSMRLKDAWRLVLRIEVTGGVKRVVIDEITNHYGD